MKVLPLTKFSFIRNQGRIMKSVDSDTINSVRYVCVFASRSVSAVRLPDYGMTNKHNLCAYRRT